MSFGSNIIYMAFNAKESDIYIYLCLYGSYVTSIHFDSREATQKMHTNISMIFFSNTYI